MFGEMGLMLGQPRSATVLCSTPPLRGSGPEKNRRAETGGLCVVNEIKGEDFVRMLKQSESFLKSMKVILRTRMFRQARCKHHCDSPINISFVLVYSIQSFGWNMYLHRFVYSSPHASLVVLVNMAFNCVATWTVPVWRCELLSLGC